MWRGRRPERQEDQQPLGHGGNAHRYQMHQRMGSIGDDYWIEDEGGNKVFRVNGKALRARQTLIFEDAQGRELAKIQERLLYIKDAMEIEGLRGERLAVVKKVFITPLRDRFTAHIKNGPELEVEGNILDHEYTIGVGRDKVAEVSKKWFRVRDSYGVEIEPGQDDIVVLAVTVVINQMAHQTR